MELFLMVAAMGMLGLAFTALAFGAATQREAPPAQPAERVPETVIAVTPARFFGDTVAPAAAAQALAQVKQGQRIPLEVLLLQIESHIRLEQAAAESFVELPTAALLHGRTASPLVN